jgi:hypothetical protein
MIDQADGSLVGAPSAMTVVRSMAAILPEPVRLPPICSSERRRPIGRLGSKKGCSEAARIISRRSRAGVTRASAAGWGLEYIAVRLRRVVAPTPSLFFRAKSSHKETDFLGCREQA